MDGECLDSGMNSQSNEDLTEKRVQDDTADRDRLLYGASDVPPVGVLIPVALQQVVANVAGILFTAYVVSDVVYAEVDNPIRATIFSTTLLMSGVCTILQSFFGVRLPIFQGPAGTFIVPLIAIKNTQTWRCETLNASMSDFNSTHNTSSYDDGNDGTLRRLRELQGSLVTAGLVETAIGCFGLAGMLRRFIGPLSVTSVIVLIALSLVDVVVGLCKAHWPLALLSLSLMVVFSLYLRDIQLPVPTKIQKRRVITTSLPVFKFLPVLLSMLIAWLLCWALTVTDTLTTDRNELAYKARTDAKDRILTSTSWFYFPYPGQYGNLGFNTAVFIGFIFSVFASVVESVGDYYVASGTCEVPPPPSHAVNRGIMVEGLGGILSGLYGSGHATTSYTGDIAIINITKVASRYSMVLTGVYYRSSGCQSGCISYHYSGSGAWRSNAAWCGTNDNGRHIHIKDSRLEFVTEFSHFRPFDLCRTCCTALC